MSTAEKIRWTHFVSVKDVNNPTPRETTFVELQAVLAGLLEVTAATKNALPCFCPYTLRAAHRLNENVEAVTLAVIDCDQNTTKEIETALDQLNAAAHQYILYTSPSDTGDDAPGALRKVRLVIPIDRPVAPGNSKALRLGLASWLGLTVDPASLDPSRVFYVGKLEGSPTRLILSKPEGRPMVAEGLIGLGAPLAVTTSAPNQAIGGHNQRTLQLEDAAITGADIDRLVSVVGPLCVPGARHIVCRNLGSWLAGRGWPDASIEQAVHEIQNRFQCFEDLAGRLKDALDGVVYPGGYTHLKGLLGEAPMNSLDRGIPHVWRGAELDAWESEFALSAPNDRTQGKVRVTEVKRTDDGIADVVAAKNSHCLKFCERRKSWLCWDGVKWSLEDGEAFAFRAVAQLVKQLQLQAVKEVEDPENRSKMIKELTSYESSAKIKGAMTALQMRSDTRVRHEDLDADPYLLNCANGVLDLRTGQLSAHDPSLLMTRCTGVNYVPQSRSQLWESYLRDLTAEHVELYRYLQRAAGVSLIGRPEEKKFWFLYGVPDSGKSLFLHALKAALGSYAGDADIATWLQHTSVGGNRGDLVSLAGTRIVVTSEIPRNAKLNTALLKSVTGGDTVRAAAKYQNEVDVFPSFTLWWAANDRPRARDDDSGFWVRLQVIGCHNQIPKERQDKRLAELWKRPEHAEAILAWAVAGYGAWLQEGLGSCDVVDREVQGYRDSQDPTAAFFAECVQSGVASDFVTRKDLRACWDGWCEENGDGQSRFVNPKDLYEKAGRIFKEGQNAQGGRGWKGIRLTVDGSKLANPFGTFQAPAQQATGGDL